MLEQSSEVIEIAQKTVSMLEVGSPHVIACRPFCPVDGRKQAEETMAKTRAEVAEDLMAACPSSPRLELAQELARAVHGEAPCMAICRKRLCAPQLKDQRRLLAALTAADAAGFTSSEAAVKL